MSVGDQHGQHLPLTDCCDVGSLYKLLSLKVARKESLLSTYVYIVQNTCIEYTYMYGTPSVAKLFYDITRNMLHNTRSLVAMR